MVGNHSMVVSSAVEDAPVFKVISQMPAGPIRVELSKKQLRSFRVSEMKNASGVFLALSSTCLSPF